MTDWNKLVDTREVMVRISVDVSANMIKVLDSFSQEKGVSRKHALEIFAKVGAGEYLKDITAKTNKPTPEPAPAMTDAEILAATSEA